MTTTKCNYRFEVLTRDKRQFILSKLITEDLYKNELIYFDSKNCTLTIAAAREYLVPNWSTLNNCIKLFLRSQCLISCVEFLNMVKQSEFSCVVSGQNEKGASYELIYQIPSLSFQSTKRFQFHVVPCYPLKKNHELLMCDLLILVQNYQYCYRHYIVAFRFRAKTKYDDVDVTIEQKE